MPVWESRAVRGRGVKYFRLFFNSPNFGRLTWNTMSISLYSIAAMFPIPITLAIALNECRLRYLRKTVQMVAYAPSFISTVVLLRREGHPPNERHRFDISTCE